MIRSITLGQLLYLFSQICNLAFDLLPIRIEVELFLITAAFSEQFLRDLTCGITSLVGGFALWRGLHVLLFSSHF